MRLTMVVPDLPRALNAALEGLVCLNVELLLAAIRAGHLVPPLYSSGIRYKREPKGREWWQSVADNLVDKTADCEDLAGHLAAQYRVWGIVAGVPYPARAICVRTGPHTYHAIVEHPDGRREDPSSNLGMGKPRRRP